jgi:hypothetical protein
MIISHCYKKKNFHSNKNQNKVDLSEAVYVTDGFVLCPDVHQHLWDCDHAYTDVSKGQMREKEIHCGVETRVRADGQNYEKIAQNGNQVNGQEQAKEEGLQFWIICQPQKKEFGNSSFV